MSKPAQPPADEEILETATFGVPAIPELMRELIPTDKPRVLTIYPPNFALIKRAFGHHLRGKGVIFAFGSVIYNPERIKIPPQLFAHEAVHQKRQGENPGLWWNSYIADVAFRLEEEIPAHQAEYADMATRLSGRALDEALEKIAERLSGPLYGKLISLNDARRIIADGQRASR